ncbi:uncharacterized protein EV420DRAFT_1521772 [Desarmillaria tabescens]|uniref:Uncharacterized protein n=1 Tax=Armillaria tabescens TaxID=1929756 RepID=A0AA39TQG2_ARMTA|nr:uncharacterized protein EV420DRAFT_1521772 [Desarmillaria tabescens]KAK0462943.1 hypothetical protein EV420DRAFT_1521772 [Desarmillaria tabescens]
MTMFAALDPSLLPATTMDTRRCNICKAHISSSSLWKRCDDCRRKRTAEHRRWREGKKGRLSLFPASSTAVTVPLKRKAAQLETDGPSKRPKAMTHGKETKQQDCQFHPTWKPVSLTHMHEELRDLPQKQDACLHASHSIIASADIDHLQRARLVAHDLRGYQLISSKRKTYITDIPGGCSLLFSCACLGPSIDCLGSTRITVEDDMSHPLGIKGQKISVVIHH